MSGSVLSAGVVFLVPAVAAGIALIVGVMAFNSRFVSRENRSRGEQRESARPEPMSIEPSGPK